MQAYSVGFSATLLWRHWLSFVLSPREAPPQTMQFLTLYPTNFTVLDEMLAYSRYRTNPEVICINQDVPTCFYAVQRSRLPIIAMLLDRGLSDTNRGEVNQIYYTKFKIFCSFPPCLPSSLRDATANAYGIGRKTVVNSQAYGTLRYAIHLNTSLSGRCEASCCFS
jgi:hypothetical protein